MKRILIINGPNLNMLGKREPEVYGRTTLKELEKKCVNESKRLDLNISFLQSNSEAKIIDKIISSYFIFKFKKKVCIGKKER